MIDAVVLILRMGAVVSASYALYVVGQWFFTRPLDAQTRDALRSPAMRLRFWWLDNWQQALVLGSLIVGWSFFTAGLGTYLGRGAVFLAVGVFFLGLVGFKVIATLGWLGAYTLSQDEKKSNP